MTTTIPGWHTYPPPPPPPLLGPALPRHGEPGWTMWPSRAWRLDPLARAPRRLVGTAVAVGVLGTALWRPSVLSVGYLVVGLLVFGAVYGTVDRRPTRTEWVGMGLTLALLAVPALLAAERLRAADLCFGRDLQGEPLQMTISIGLASALPEDRDPGELLARADAALYLAKAEGRNRVVRA